MRLLRWLPGKSKHSLAALSVALWWGGYAFLGYRTEAAPAAGSQGTWTVTVLSLRQSCPATKNAYHNDSVKSVYTFPQPTQSQVWSALNGFFLKLNRKPRPSITSAPAARATWFYPCEESPLRLLPPVAQQRTFDQRRIHLHCCSLLI
jgi:hypothetical protein